MENTPTSHIEERIRAALPEVAIERVQVLAHGDDPGVGPGQTAVRVLLGRAGRPEGPEADKEILTAYTDAAGRHAALKQLSDELPFIAWIEFLPYLQDESTRHGGPLGRGPVSRFSIRGGGMMNAPTARVEERIRSAFPEGTVERVQVLAHGDDPEVGPGQTAVRIFLSRAGRPEGPEADKEILMAARDGVPGSRLGEVVNELPFIEWIEFRPHTEDETAAHVGPSGEGPSIRISPREQSQAPRPGEPQEQLTPVMTRLGAADLTAVDTLIAAGIAGSRAELLRWAVGRIREHPAYAQIQDRVHEISELKAQF